MSAEKAKAGGVFTVQCFDKDGNLKWQAQEHNLVVNVGLKDMNEKYFTGSSYTRQLLASSGSVCCFIQRKHIPAN